MGDLDPSVLKQFHNSFGDDDITSRESRERSARLTETSGIAGLIPGSSLDSFLFSPCGYSMNGLKGDKYWTIHVTPQPSCNFASFETGRFIFRHHQYGKAEGKQCPRKGKIDSERQSICSQNFIDASLFAFFECTFPLFLILTRMKINLF